MRFLSNKEKKELAGVLPVGYEVSKKDQIKEKDGILYKGDDKFLIVDEEGKYLPHMKSIPEDEYKAVFVDKGAIPFILKGADLMRPGIQRFDVGFGVGDVVMIRDENHNKLLALGIALVSAEEMETQDKGKSLRIYNFFNDEKY